MKLNIANKITLGRIYISILIIIILLFPFDTISLSFPKYLVNGVYIDSKYIIAGVLFIIASLSDFIDGYLARKYNIITDYGKTMDAIADKVLVNSTLIILSSQGFVHPAITVVIIVRDIFTTAFKTLSGSKGKVIAAINLGKYKTAFLMAGIVATLFYNLPFEFWGINIAGYLLIVAAFLSVASGIQYYNMTKKYFN